MATSVQDINIERHEKIPWRPMQAKRTDAMPKHSLFGTALENYDREGLKDIQGRYIPEGTIKKPPERYPLPDHLKALIPGRDFVESSRRETQHHHNRLSEADENLKNKSEQVLSFRDPSNPRISKSRGSKISGQSGWLTEKDLEHSKDINIVGLNPRGNYNRDKYGRRPQMHNYSLIGDILAPKKGDFNAMQEEKRDFVTTISGNRTAKPGSHINEEHKYEKKTNSRSLVDLPPNIRHKFGSRECDNLLSDQHLVTLALERQREKSGPLRPSKREKIEALPLNMADNYMSLGHTTRYNICPGISSGHTISRTKSEFNDEVHLRRVPDTDEFRYQRDELSTWSEHNVLRERMKKAWDDAYPLGIWVEQDVLRKRMEGKWKSYFDGIPKLGANWDRNAKRPVIMVPTPAKPKPQPRPRNRKAANADPQPTPGNEDEIVFVTPPLTPPPAQEERIELPKKFEKDEEFWSFYDQ